MTILWLNARIPQLMKRQIMRMQIPPLLQMMSQSYEGEGDYLNLWKARMIPTPFLPLKSKTGWKVTYVQNKEDICLTERQADHVYKAMEKG